MRSTSFDNTIGGWEKIISATSTNEGLLPGSEYLRVALEWHLQEAKAVKARQMFHTAEREQATRELRQLRAAGRELAIRLGSLAKSAFGPRDERLGLFGVASIKPRVRKAKQQQPSAGSSRPEPAK